MDRRNDQHAASERLSSGKRAVLAERSFESEPCESLISQQKPFARNLSASRASRVVDPESMARSERLHDGSSMARQHIMECQMAQLHRRVKQLEQELEVRMICSTQYSACRCYT
jgi:hypothetical protein